MQNIKDNLLNDKKEDNNNNSLSVDESFLLNKILEEYNDLFPEIMKLKKEDFISSFQKYIQIYFASKNILFSTDIINKIMHIILNDYYLPEKDKIDILIQNINKSQIYIDKGNKNYIPHCYNTSRPMHICGEKYYKLDNGKYFYCLKCNKIYDQKSVLLFCDNCQKDYYSEIKENNNIINKNKIDYKLKPATWVKYHCNASMNDTMKCPKCFNNFYLNMKNRLFCIKCNYEIEQLNIKWKCKICGKDFFSEAKEYNPLLFKIIRLSIKSTIFNGIEAKPPFIPCCNVSQSHFGNLKFMHKKECNGILYEGILDNTKIVVCLKCNMINLYENHFWLCPLCKNKFNLYNNKYEKNSDENNLKENNNYYKTDINEKKYKKYMRNNNSQYLHQKLSKKNYYNNKYEKDFGPKSYRDKERKDFNNIINTDDQNLSLKKYKSGDNEKLSNVLNNLYHKTDMRENNKYQNYYNTKIGFNNIKKKENISDNYYYKELKTNKSINGITNINKEILNSYSNEDNNNEKLDFSNGSSKLLRMANYYKEKQKGENFHDYIYKNNIKSSKNNNIKSLHSIINNLSNININLNVNVNINNSQKEKLLKSLSSNKIAQRKPNLSKDNNKNIKIYRKHVKNLSIDLGKDTPIKSSLDNFNIDDYNIVKSIGEGSFGKIFEVKDKYHRHFAMKKLVCNSIKEIEILKKEYEYLYNYEDLHINLVQIYGIETKKLDKTTFVMYVLMELAKTDWEKEILQRKRINNYYTEKELMIILNYLTKTLSKLQQNNISHRDIKPQNILLCDGDILKISDFGEAKENLNNNYNDTVKQTIRGTELYMSPALFRSLKQKVKSKYSKHNTYKSDVFSLGYCILLAATLNFECLYSIREILDMNLIKNKIKTFLNERYSEKFINILLIMLESEEKNRPDFIQLEKILNNI